MVAAENSCLARMQRICPARCIALYRSSILAPPTPKACRTPSLCNEYARYWDVVSMIIRGGVSCDTQRIRTMLCEQASGLAHKAQPAHTTGHICPVCTKQLRGQWNRTIHAG